MKTIIILFVLGAILLAGAIPGDASSFKGREFACLGVANRTKVVEVITISEPAGFSENWSVPPIAQTDGHVQILSINSVPIRSVDGGWYAHWSTDAPHKFIWWSPSQTLSNLGCANGEWVLILSNDEITDTGDDGT